MADNGVTKGCNPPANDEYCPEQNVTREQMAAFMHRLETEGVFLPADGTAANADTVDGQHASAFAAADHRHTALFGTATRTVLDATSSTSYEDIADMTTQVTIPSGHTGVIVAMFNSDVRCVTTGSGDRCAVRIIVDGTEIGPSTGPYFDDVDDGGGIESHGIQRISGELGPGTYTVKAQFTVDHADQTIALRNSSLVAEVKLTS